jgi:Arc/MetJ family transcription regulator
MRTNIVLDESLVKKAMKLSRTKTKKEFVENRKRLNLMDLAGKIEFATDYNYKALRIDK